MNRHISKNDEHSSSVFHLNSISKHHVLNSLAKSIQDLSQKVEKKLKQNQVRKNSMSSRISSITYESLSPEMTLQKSLKYPLVRNPIEEKKQTLSLLNDSLQMLLNRFEDEIEEMNNRLNCVPLCQQWNIELDSLNDDAEDLHVWNQVFEKV